MKNTKVTEFYDLNAWKKSHSLVLEIYKLTSIFPKEELYGIVSQLRRASSSVTANIAEGFAHYHFKNKTRFYYSARASLAEVENFLILAKDLRYISQDKQSEVREKINNISKLINGLIRSTKKEQNN